MNVGGLTPVDWIIVVILASSVLVGLARGFFRSVFSLAGLIIGVALASWNYWRIAAFVKRFIHSVELADAIGFITIAAAVLIVAAILGSLLAKFFQKVGLGCLDRLAGALFGLAQGLVFVTLSILVTVAFFPQTAWLTEARLPRYFFGALHVSIQVTPSRLGQRVRKELNTLETKSQEWMNEEKNK
ncbi:CvpA family protein [Occallatibacter savannae]|uniref:CvpA family protein n=1 Tax=Occallatibacter savannae TaxID=1002691 RepID=UPI000D691F9E|nr:CvpA family protein [Occallatibacter savannae]